MRAYTVQGEGNLFSPESIQKTMRFYELAAKYRAMAVHDSLIFKNSDDRNQFCEACKKEGIEIDETPA